LRTALRIDPDVRVMAQMASNDEAVRQSARLRPNVVILDGVVADGGLVELCRALRTRAPHTRVVVLIGAIEASSVIHAVRAGAEGCIAESSHPDDVRRVVRVAAGKTNREIASDLAVSEKTVKNWLAHAFGKLRVTRRAEAAVRFTMPYAPADALWSKRIERVSAQSSLTRTA